MPPIDDALRDALLQAAWQSLLLPMVAAAIVFLGFLFVPRGAFFGAVLAVIVGFAAANHFRDAVDPRILPIPDAADDAVKAADPNLDPSQIAWAAATSLGGPSIGASTVKSRLWLPWCVMLAGIAGTIGRLPWMPTTILRVAAALAATILLVAPAIQAEASWLAPVFALVLVTEWELIDTIGRQEPGGVLPLSLAIAFGAAAVVVIHAHTVKYADAALILAACCLGIALTAALRRGDASGLAPIAAVALPGLMLVVRSQTESLIPVAGFAAIALAPLGLLPAALMGKCGSERKWMRSLAIVAGPAAVAALGVTLAMMYESLPTE
ncbi:MAG TPA: hypothetical protein VHR72_02605 [Gemmataceae bacterium]|jgi:hypothetical protein|nr:hypothetical protein [Gemmataceae bacterium]